jgi:hypothetical protein
MGSSSANDAAAALSAFSFGFLPPVSEKLTRGNYTMWHAQVFTTLIGAQLAGYIDPTAAPPDQFVAGETDKATGKKSDPVPNPAYTKWVTQDAQVLSYLFSSLSKDVFAQVASAKTSADVTPDFRRGTKCISYVRQDQFTHT